MKKTVLLVGLCIAGTGFAFSQNTPGNDGPKLLNQLNTTCHLTSEQMAKLQPVVSKHAQTLEADKKQYKGAALAKADNAESIRFDKQLKTILSAEQMKLYKSSNSISK